MTIKILEHLGEGARSSTANFRIEKCNCVSIVCRAYAIVEVIEHEGANVDGARGGSQDDNESWKIENFPALWQLWHDNKLFVHMIPQNRDLRHVIKKGFG